MLAIQVPIWMCVVALPMSCAVASASLFTSVVKMASNPAASASRATFRTSLARHPAPGMTVIPSRCVLMAASFPLCKGGRHGARSARLRGATDLRAGDGSSAGAHAEQRCELQR